MAKRVIMIPPFEVLTGNLSGAQDLRYKENNNKAYEAPNGSASARNYVTRYVGAKRADGKSYFAVRRKTTTTLNNKTRTNMAILGSIAAIRSALQYSHSTDWANLKGIYEYRKAHGWDEAGTGVSFNKWIDYWLRRILLNKQDGVTLSASGLSVTINNPFLSYDDNAALVISIAIFRKFNRTLSTDSQLAQFTINGMSFDFQSDMSWNDPISNPNYTAMWSGINAPSADDAPVTFNNLPVYTSAGVAVKSDMQIIANEKYTTIAPQA